MNRIAGLREAAKTVRPFDLAGGIADDESDPPDTGDGVAARELAAEDIRAVLLEPGLTADAQGFQIRGAIVTGTLNLDYAKIPCRLMFNHCRFESAPTFEQAILPALALTHVLLPGLNLDGADIRGNVTLDEVKATGEVRAVAAQIGGQLILENKVKLSNPGGEALSLDSVDIRGSVYMSGIEVTGRVRAVQARMHRQLYLMGSGIRRRRWFSTART